jgi:hypothetical protein
MLHKLFNKKYKIQIIYKNIHVFNRNFISLSQYHKNQ